MKMRISAGIALFCMMWSSLCSAQSLRAQEELSFEDLIGSVSKRPQPEPLSADEAARLQYCVSEDAVKIRKSKVVEKAQMVDPGMKDNGKQSLRVDSARLQKDPKDPKALANIIKAAPFNGKSAHFTKLGLANLYGQFRDEFPPEVLSAIKEQAPAYKEYMGDGTENHIGMQRVSAVIFGAAYPDMKTANGISAREMEEIGTKWIQDYGKTVFRTSMKEYLSLIYLGVHNEIWLTASEYAPRESQRTMSKAMLDWLWTDLAVNTHLCQTIPPATRAKTMLDRGAQTTYPRTHAQWLAWLYWGDLHSYPGTEKLPPAAEAISPGCSIDKMMKDNDGFQTAIMPSISEQIPSEIIRNIGAKNIDLPYMLLQSRPRGTMLAATAFNKYLPEKKRGGEDITNNNMRSVYVARDYALGTGYFLRDEFRDNEQYMHLLPGALVYRSGDELNSVIVSHPYWYAGEPHGNDEEAAKVFGLDCWLGKSPFEQTLHWENTVIYLYNIPDEDPAAKADLTASDGKWVSSRLLNPLKSVCAYVPESIDETRQTDWGWFLREGGVYFAMRPFGAQKAEWQHCTNEVQSGYKRLVMDGSLMGLIVEIGDAEEYGTPEEFITKVGAAKPDLSDFSSKKTVRYVSTRGIPFEMKYSTESWFPDASVKDVKLDFDKWPTCESPYVTSRNGVLNVNDGKKGFVIDWSGNAPVYSYYDVKN